ncbi:hypothetical protein DBR32_11190 [Taibaiella sp. KBW10]|uniref:hypothetical protein n=1 Tax=Taibaiella sp. KBW10 TaxID=2153357 RepID=UPI000F5B6C2D|nr:hypothetical protein [Taibaiella sp. KBW10]RQO30143.1 hypothetical protein DBR32_11190 [Taibaiella sp. KBW10]
MTPTEIKQIIRKNERDIAFIIGNGINRYPNNPNALSWDDLLIQLWDKVSLQTLTRRPNGISLTEFYDILELEKVQDIYLQKEVADLMRHWEPLDHHQLITNKIKSINAPLLTTNFEETFVKTVEGTLLRTEQEGFTDFYPWSTYHGTEQLVLPTDGFGIWYINGMINYHRSIRLGLSHYMGSVQRARGLLYKGQGDEIFSDRNLYNWKGVKTWLQIVFNKSLFIFGLGLEENETFFRWLLIERMKYFKKYVKLKHKGWYINKRNNNEIDLGKRFFLERVGFEVIDVDDYKDIYENIWVDL